MIYKLTSVKRIIGVIANDLQITEEIPWQSMVEWIARGLEHIGSYYQLSEKQEDISIEDFKGKLPCDCYKVLKMLNGFTYDDPSNSLIGENSNVDKLQAQLTKNKFNNNNFNVNFDTITTAYKTGTITIQYLAFPVDEDGFPLVPDDVSYTEALFWKVCYQLALQGYDFKNPQMRDISFCKDKWNFYCKQARANANMPDPDMMERMKNRWLSLIPNIQAYKNQWQGNGQQQNINLRGNN